MVQERYTKIWQRKNNSSITGRRAPHELAEEDIQANPTITDAGSAMYQSKRSISYCQAVQNYWLSEGTPQDIITSAGWSTGDYAKDSLFEAHYGSITLSHIRKIA